MRKKQCLPFADLLLEFEKRGRIDALRTGDLVVSRIGGLSMRAQRSLGDLHAVGSMMGLRVAPTIAAFKHRRSRCSLFAAGTSTSTAAAAARGHLECRERVFFTTSSFLYSELPL